MRVYPTENYLYFRFLAAGATVAGSLTLSARDRDAGVLGFGYVVNRDKYRDPFTRRPGGGATLGAADGVEVRRLAELRYAVTFEGRTVVFQLNVEGLEPPPPELLDDDEVYVGPCFDESGLRFFLVFNESVRCLCWLLNEREPVSETFTALGEDVVVGERTEYAFWVDATRGRKVLIGVEGLNVLQNNWYDGPFDQLPDNLVAAGEIELQPYVEQAYPHTRGRIDRFGNFLDETGSRVAIAPYLVYFHKRDLLETVTGCRARSKSRADFLACVTRQIFDVPPEITDRHPLG